MGSTSNATPKDCCLVLDYVIEDVAGQNTPYLQSKTRKGVMDALFSPENTNGFEQLGVLSGKDPYESSGPTGKVTTELKYRNKVCHTANDGTFLGCESTTAASDDWVYDHVGIDNYKNVSIKYDLAEFQQLCESPSERQVRDIAEMIDGLDKAIDSAVTTLILSELAAYADGDASTFGSGTTKTLNPFVDTGRFEANPAGMFQLFDEIEEAGYDVNPLVIASTKFGRPLRHAYPLYANDTEGRNLLALPDMTVYESNVLDGAVGDGFVHAISMVPGHQQLLWHNRFGEGSALRRFSDTVSRDTVEINGRTYDRAIAYSDCESEVTITFGTYFDLFVLPDGAYAASCGGANARQGWFVDCGKGTCPTA